MSGEVVAVLVSCHNHVPFVRQCLQSIREQTYQDIAVLFFDVNSTDESLAIVREEFPEVSVFPFDITYPIGVARWLMLHTLHVFEAFFAHIKYVAIIDADDYWVPDKIEKQVAILKANPEAKLVFSDCYYDYFSMKQQDGFPVFAPEYGEIGDRTFHDKYPVPGGDHFLNLLICYNYMPCPTLLFDKDALFDVVGDPLHYSSAEDYDWVLKVAAKYPVSYVPEPLAYYRVHSGQITAKTPARCTMEEIDVVKRAMQFRILTSKQKRQVSRHLAWLYCKLLFKEGF